MVESQCGRWGRIAHRSLLTTLANASTIYFSAVLCCPIRFSRESESVALRKHSPVYPSYALFAGCTVYQHIKTQRGFNVFLKMTSDLCDLCADIDSVFKVEKIPRLKAQCVGFGGEIADCKETDNNYY